MRRIALATLLTTFATPAFADTGLFLGGGVRWAEAGNDVTFVLRGSIDVAPLLSLGVDLHGLCTGGHELAMDFGGATVGLYLAPPVGGGFGIELGLEAGLASLTYARHGREELAPYLAAEVAGSIALGAGLALRLAFDHTLTSGDARQAVESQLVLSLGLRL